MSREARLKVGSWVLQSLALVCLPAGILIYPLIGTWSLAILAAAVPLAIGAGLLRRWSDPVFDQEATSSEEG